jgi:ribosomal protein S18 acetylase RimI-like enzyme
VLKASKFTLRPACAEDDDFLFALYANTRQAEMALLSSTEEARQRLVRIQFEAQRTHYGAIYPRAEHSVVVVSEDLAGRFYVDRQESQILVVDLCLLPEFQRQGIGKSLVIELQSEADSLGKPIVGHVACGNLAAEKFWKNLGFGFTPEDEMYSRILWNGRQFNTSC